MFIFRIDNQYIPIFSFTNAEVILNKKKIKKKRSSLLEKETDPQSKASRLLKRLKSEEQLKMLQSN